MNKTTRESITVSIVSHGQIRWLTELLEDLARCPNVSLVVLTLNIPEDTIMYPEALKSRLKVIRNRSPLGFAANHNQAFKYCDTSLFAVLNPDIRLTNDPFPQLVLALKATGSGVIAPAVRNPNGVLEDSARYFPTPLNILRKCFGLGDGRIPFNDDGVPQDVDWIAGMFMLFRSSAYCSVGGFDEGFFLYYEDVDICSRIWKCNRRVVVHPGLSVIHTAQRSSRRSLRYLKWHFCSMMRFFFRYAEGFPR